MSMMGGKQKEEIKTIFITGRLRRGRRRLYRQYKDGQRPHPRGQTGLQSRRNKTPLPATALATVLLSDRACRQAVHLSFLAKKPRTIAPKAGGTNPLKRALAWASNNSSSIYSLCVLSRRSSSRNHTTEQNALHATRHFLHTTQATQRGHYLG